MHGYGYGYGYGHGYGDVHVHVHGYGYGYGWRRVRSGNGGRFGTRSVRDWLDRLMDAYDTFGRAKETRALKVLVEAPS